MLSAIARFDAAGAAPTPGRSSNGKQPSGRRLVTSNTSNRASKNDDNVANGNTNNIEDPTTTNLNLLVLELHRLLHCMERNNNNNDEPSSTTTFTSISWQALTMRMELLQSLWQQVQQAVFEARQQRDDDDDPNNNNRPSHYYKEEELEPPGWYRDYEQRVYKASQKAQEAIHALQRQEAAEQQQREEEEHCMNIHFTNNARMSLIDQIFFPPEEKQEEQEEEEEEQVLPVEHDLIGDPMPVEPMEEEEEEEQDDDHVRHNNSTRPSASNYSSRNNNNNNNNVDIQAFQKEQREQIEQAIALMASQMKQETERIHSTLKGQNTELLEELDDIATHNVEAVTQVTQDVTTHVSDGWKRSFGTITLLLMVASLFLFSLVTIYMIPKYNSPMSSSSSIPPALQKFCRTVNGKEECLDLNAWLTGSGSTQQDKNEKEASAPYFTTLDEDDAEEETAKTSQQPPMDKEEQVQNDDYLDQVDPQAAQECEIGMDGRCIPEDHHQSEEILHTQQALEEKLERERLAAVENENQKQKQSQVPKETDGRSTSELNERDLQRQQRQQIEGKEQQRRASEHSHGEQRLHDEHQEPILDHGQYGGESEFDLAQRREQLLKEREQRENLHKMRQMQGQEGTERQNPNQGLEGRERARMELEEQMKRRDEFRERELQQLEEQRRQRELKEEQQRLRQEEAERKRQEQERQEQAKRNLEEEEESFDLPPPPPSESFMEQARGFEAFRDQQEPYKPRKLKPAAQGGGGAGFGGGAGEADPFPAQKAAGTDGSSAGKEDQPPPEPEFRGRPFAPRDIRRAAASGENDELKDYLEQRPNWVNKPDKNNWAAIHLAVRAGHLGAVEILLHAGADINGRTAQGLTPLGMATERLGEGHPITNLLRKDGGEV